MSATGEYSYKPGDKVEIFCGASYELTRRGKGLIIPYKIGDILELVAEKSTGETEYYSRCVNEKMVCFASPHGGLISIDGRRYHRIAVKFIRPCQHSCRCPRENFAWNGKGCVCGGK